MSTKVFEILIYWYRIPKFMQESMLYILVVVLSKSSKFQLFCYNPNNNDRVMIK